MYGRSVARCHGSARHPTVAALELFQDRVDGNNVSGSGDNPSLLLTLGGGSFTATAQAPALPRGAWLLMAALLVGVTVGVARLRWARPDRSSSGYRAVTTEEGPD